MGNRLYVGNLSFNATETDLMDLFGQAGQVKDVALIQDRVTGKSRGFAFVTMTTDEEAATAISTLNGKNVEGRTITVNEARPREERTGVAVAAATAAGAAAATAVDGRRRAATAAAGIAAVAGVTAVAGAAAEIAVAATATGATAATAAADAAATTAEPNQPFDFCDESTPGNPGCFRLAVVDSRDRFFARNRFPTRRKVVQWRL